MDIEKIVDNLFPIIKEDIENDNTYDPKKTAKDLIKAITDLMRSVKRFNEKTGALGEIKPNNYKAKCEKVKAAIEAAEADKDFEPIANQVKWNVLKREVSTGTMMPKSEEDEKAALKFYIDMNGLIRQANKLTAIGGLKEPEDLIRDLSGGNIDKQKHLKGVPTRAFKRALSGPTNSRVATDEELENLKNTKDYKVDDKRLENLENEFRAKADALESRERGLRDGTIKNEKVKQEQKANKIITTQDKKNKYGKQQIIKNHEEAANISSMKDAPVDNQTSISNLLKYWKSNNIEPKGQIKIIATDASGIGTGAGKPVFEINGKLYSCGRKFLLQRQYGGYFCKPTESWENPYYGYFTDVRKDSKYDELRQKIKNAMLEESVSYFNY